MRFCGDVRLTGWSTSIDVGLPGPPWSDGWTVPRSARSRSRSPLSEKRRSVKQGEWKMRALPEFSRDLPFGSENADSGKWKGSARQAIYRPSVRPRNETADPSYVEIKSC